MAGGPSDANKSSPSGLPTRKKKLEWGPGGKLVEVWVDVPAKKPKKKGMNLSNLILVVSNLTCGRGRQNGREPG